jgi:hypothetical protein
MSIFDHISIKVGDSATVNAFYQAALAPLGITQKFLAERADGLIGGYGREQVNFFVAQSHFGGKGPHPSGIRSRQQGGG